MEARWKEKLDHVREYAAITRNLLRAAYDQDCDSVNEFALLRHRCIQRIYALHQNMGAVTLTDTDPVRVALKVELAQCVGLDTELALALQDLRRDLQRRLTRVSHGQRALSGYRVRRRRDPEIQDHRI